MIFGCAGLNNCPEKTLPRKRVITVVQGSRFKVQGSRFKVQGSQIGVRARHRVPAAIAELGTWNLELGTF
jgi:hypothetical protein